MKNILITSYYEIKNYFMKNDKKIKSRSYKHYFSKFERTIKNVEIKNPPDYMFIYVENEKHKISIEKIMIKKKIKVKYKIIVKEISEEALEIKKYIASNCNRKVEKRKLPENVAKNLITVWCNKISLLKYTNELLKEQINLNNCILTWCDFGKFVSNKYYITFNEKAIVSENRVTRIPENFDLKLAPLFGCSVTTGFGVINNDAELKIGQSIVVFGLGGVGLNIVQAAQMVSAYPIIGVDLHKTKLDLGLKFGLSHAITGNSDLLYEEIFDISGSNGADVVVDTTGISNVIEMSYELTHPDGKTILVGVPSNPVSIFTLPLHFNKVFTGSHGGNAMPSIDIPRYIRLINAGKMELDGLVTNEFPLEKINEALELFRSGTAGKIIIKT